MAGQGGTAARLIECGVVRPGVGRPLPERLQTIHEGVTTLIQRHHPDQIAVESVFFGRHAQSALILGHARGVILLAAAQSALSLIEIAPSEVKRAVTGTGRATKAQVGEMVARLLRLAAPPTPADAADGVAIALTALLRLEPRVRLAGGIR